MVISLSGRRNKLLKERNQSTAVFLIKHGPQRVYCSGLYGGNGRRVRYAVGSSGVGNGPSVRCYAA